MKNERNVSIQEDEQEPKHRYRLNKRKFTVALALFCFAIAGCIIAVQYLNSDDGREAIAALSPPQPTAKNNPAVSIIDPEHPLEGKIIVVDAGHGGDDPGTTGVNGSMESELNLSVAFVLKQQFESEGARVVMTRSEDRLADTKDQDWEKRQEIISGAGSDILVSIHMNSFGDSSVSGPLVLFMPGSGQGKSLAQTVQKSMNDELAPETPGTARSEDLIILRYGYQPSVLVECGFISNPQEEENLNTQDYQLKVTKAICDGVIEYFTNN